MKLEHIEVEGRWLPRLEVTKVRLDTSPLVVGDVILALDGQVVDERADLFDFLTKERIGWTTRVEVLRSKEICVLDVVPTRWKGGPHPPLTTRPGRDRSGSGLSCGRWR